MLRAIAPAHFDRASEVVGEFEYVHYFVTTQAELDESFPELRAHIESHGTLWISWPKGGQLDTDLNLHSVIAIGYNNLYGTLIRQDAA